MTMDNAQTRFKALLTSLDLTVQPVGQDEPSPETVELLAEHGASYEVRNDRPRRARP